MSSAKLIQQSRPKPLDGDPLWYLDAVIYQLHVRSFYDSDGDGVGDFRGLTEKLAYVQSLGVTAIWLLPFFPSPLKDDGYDIADYTSINPAYGSLADFTAFVDEAHKRGLHVITELVMNHTSDQHAWFQQSRRAEPGSKWRDFYVWSDSSHRYRDARIIFHDFETSNWTWDPVAKAYYWHRFYHHQPDLNFENPEVRQAMFDAIDFWLEQGVDGLRLDAVPYLYERDGTDCENLPETHGFLKSLREHVDRRFRNKMLLAEANQWPEDAAEYFGSGDECHMNFHFPLMPRLFIAVEREDHFPIVDILDQTPPLPEGCQWGIFLRNHDELTLEMVTDEERDYMYRVYASDPQTRLNQGIRRRLSPLLQNNRRKVELLNGLLFSLPGTPIVYYGDEIGMGDNIYLGDRDGVRTPMQWSPDRNAGFSRCGAQRLFLPVIVESAYHYLTVNVEVDNDSPHSLLWWMRRLMHLRAQFKAFGRGDFRLLKPENAKVLAFLRQYQDETLLIVANLSRFAQCVELDLSEFRGQVPVELFGRVTFPAIGELPYFLTLGSHAFYWFQLRWEAKEEIELSPDQLPVCELERICPELFFGRSKRHLESALRPFLRRDRWFKDATRRIYNVELSDALPLAAAAEEAVYWILLVSVEFYDHEFVAYQIPVVIADQQAAGALTADHPSAGILRVNEAKTDSPRTLCDASWDRGFWTTLYHWFGQNQAICGQRGESFAVRTPEYDQAGCEGPLVDRSDSVSFQSDMRAASVEEGSVSAVLSGRYELRLFRHLNGGVTPAFELGRVLNRKSLDTFVPRVYAAIQYRRDNAPVQSLAILSQYRAAECSLWNYTLDELSRSFERQQAAHFEGITAEHAPSDRFGKWLKPEPAEENQELFGVYLHSISQLGRRTAELHAALASVTEDPEMIAQPLSELYQRSLYQSIRSSFRRCVDALAKHGDRLQEQWRQTARQIIDSQEPVLDGLRQDLSRKLDGQRIRCHGNYELQQVMFTGDDFVITGLAGKARRPNSEVRIKTSPLRDIASMIVSLLAASHAALHGGSASLVIVPEEQRHAQRFMHHWFDRSASTLLVSYRDAIERTGLLPADDDDLTNLLRVHLFEQSCLKLWDSITDDSSKISIPLEGMRMLMDSYENKYAERPGEKQP